MNKCPHCGKDIADKEAKFCPHCSKSLTESPISKDVVVNAVREAVAPLNTELESLKSKIAAFEKSPANKFFNVNAGVTTEKYRGYQLADQGEKLREKFAARPLYYKTLSKADTFTNFAKFMLDVKAALCGDIQAIMQLQSAAAAFKASDLAEGSDSLGGYAVPPEYQMDLLKLVREDSFLLKKATVIPMKSNTLKMPSEASLVSVTWEDEAAAIDEQNPTFGQVVLTAKKLAGLTSGISSELLQDSGVDIVGMITEQFLYAIGQEYDNQGLNGTGSPCSGVLTAAAGYSVVMASGSTAFSSVNADVIRNMIRKLSAKDAAVAEFVYSKDIQYYIDTLKDSNGRYLYREPSGERPAALWNRGIFESAKAPGESDSGVSKGFIALGNWKQFYVGQRIGAMAFASDPYTKFANDQVRFRAIVRTALKIARSSAFVRAVTAGE